MIKSQALNKRKLPDAPGVYLFKSGRTLLYIGRATSIRDRVRSYFAPDLISTRGPFIVDMVYKASNIDFIQTDSVLEAIILEANLIKKNQPKYNTKEKDNKSFNYVVITKEDYPRVLIMRGREIVSTAPACGLATPPYLRRGFEGFTAVFGPFTNASQLKDAIKIIRKIFPFRDKCQPLSGKPCFNRQIGLCPGICSEDISKTEYRKIIRNIKLFFQGKKKQIISNLNKEMKSFAKKNEFEKAGEIRNKISALNHIQDVAIIASEATTFSPPQLRRGDYSDNRGGCFRIEAYDAAHLSGTNNVGVMVVMEDSELKKADYRKFIIRNSKGNDIAALKEILERRLKHTEWPLPNLIVLDGGVAQLNIARIVWAGKGSTLDLKKGRTLRSPILVAVTKDDKHKPKALIGPENIIKKNKKEILLVNAEAHRFAIAFHRKKRSAII